MIHKASPPEERRKGTLVLSQTRKFNKQGNKKRADFTEKPVKSALKTLEKPGRESSNPSNIHRISKKFTSKKGARKSPGTVEIPGFFGAISILVAQDGSGRRIRIIHFVSVVVRTCSEKANFWSFLFAAVHSCSCAWQKKWQKNIFVAENLAENFLLIYCHSVNPFFTHRMFLLTSP